MSVDISKEDSGGSSGYDSSTLNITRDRYYSSSTSDDLTYLKPFIREIYRTDLTCLNSIQTRTTYNSSKTIQKRYPTEDDGSEMAVDETDDLPEVGLLYPSGSIISEEYTKFKLYDTTTRADVLDKYKDIRFTVYGDVKIQSNIGKYYADGLDTFLYATDEDKNLLDKTYRWAIMTKHLTDNNRLLCIPLIKKTETVDTDGSDINVLRYHLKYIIKNASKNTSVTSEEYTKFINSLYKGNGNSPISESDVYAIPIQSVYTKFTTVGPIGYDASYSSCSDILSSSVSKNIRDSIDEKYENRDRVIADSVPPYKLYSIFFYNKTLYLQEDYYTEGVTLHDSVKNNLSYVTMHDIMKYYYPPLLNEYGHAVKLASNLPENKLYILINGQGGGGAYITVDHKSDKYKLANGGNAGNSASLILLMKDTYGTSDDGTYSSAKYPQCIIKIPAHPTQSISCIYPMGYNGNGGNAAYNCEILFKLGQKYIITSGKGGLSEECEYITDCVNENDSNRYDIDTDSDSSITLLGQVYNIADGKQFVHRMNNGHYIIPFRSIDYSCQYNVIYDGDKTSLTSKTGSNAYYGECYTRGSYIQYGSGKKSAVVGGGTASIFACGGCASLQYTFGQAKENIDGSYGSGGGGWSSQTTLEGTSSKCCVAGAGGAAAFSISWYNTDY